MDKEAREEHVMEAAFGTIFDLYKDEQTLEKTLASAKAQVKKLQNALRKSEARTQSLDYGLDKASRGLRELDRRLQIETSSIIEDEGDAKGEVRDPQHFENIIRETERFVKRSQAYISHQSESQKIKKEIERAKRYVKMLEGAKLVADAGGMKRARGEEDTGTTRFAENLDLSNEPASPDSIYMNLIPDDYPITNTSTRTGSRR